MSEASSRWRIFLLLRRPLLPTRRDSGSSSFSNKRFCSPIFLSVCELHLSSYLISWMLFCLQSIPNWMRANATLVKLLTSLSIFSACLGFSIFVARVHSVPFMLPYWSVTIQMESGIWVGSIPHSTANETRVRNPMFADFFIPSQFLTSFPCYT